MNENRKMMIDAFAADLKACVSVYHAVDHYAGLLQAAGFEELSISGDWALSRGGHYFVRPFGRMLFAFAIGDEADPGPGIRIGGAHLDFPGIRIKPDPELIRHGYLQLNTEVYGGPILNTWFDRPLSLAGLVMTRGEDYEHPVPRLLDFGRPILCLPNLAVHMNRSVNEKGAPIDNQRHLLPILGMTGEDLAAGTAFNELLAGELGVSAEDILDYDLQIYNPAPPTIVGIREDFLMAPRLDDHTSASALIHGLIRSESAHRTRLVCLFDNEEVGSRSKQGAGGDMTRLITRRIWQAFGLDELRCGSDIAQGLLLSLDVAHAYHPNYPAPQDITNYPVMGGGVILKTASNQSYVWDPAALSQIIGLCQDEKIPYQRFVKESGTKGGGTIGSIITSQLPVRAVDLGVGLLAMHSACETMGCADQAALCRLTRAFFSR